MRERPILMTPENAQKCHDGTKTQTRRTNGLKKVNGSGPWDYPQMQSSGIAIFLDSTQANPYNNALEVTCPYGVVGDRLWVREALCRNGSVMTYLDGSPVMQGDLVMPSWCERKTIPSIHMPRFACRTVLEIAEVRVERLKDISPADALAEGVFCPEVGYAQHGERAPVLLYGFLWESIHGAGSWAQNPWVWVISFRKVGA